MANIVSVQKVSITITSTNTSNTATISSVTTANTVIFFNGQTTDNGGIFDVDEVFGYVTLTNSTTVTATRSAGAGDALTVDCTVVEFDTSLIDTVQYGTVSLGTSDASQTATITTVDLSRSAVFYLGVQSGETAGVHSESMHTVHLSGVTEVTATRGATGSEAVVGFVVAEFQAAKINSVNQYNHTVVGTDTSSDDTVTSVSVDNTILAYGGNNTDTGGYPASATSLELTAATTVTTTRSSGTSCTREIRYAVVEFVSGVLDSVQRGQIEIASSDTSNTATISSVVESRSICSWQGEFIVSLTHSAHSKALLTSSTVVTSSREGTPSNTTTAGYEVWEFSAGVAASPKGPLGHPLHGALGGPI
jgi:hypothetical protein